MHLFRHAHRQSRQSTNVWPGGNGEWAAADSATSTLLSTKVLEQSADDRTDLHYRNRTSRSNKNERASLGEAECPSTQWA